ncbi:unnamed protein product [Rotaria sp. Silwood1]|nr:unnamed protein product [Rotaria sp. Silwood1]CAF1193254.1 unnamed protein product [Rotaria sp. Silwood1]CAF1196838.1 unnamed protein product [Rotaria sp. Silwood1]CAF3491986.1 unnamed protein product [Rotaria sp. Silwood1]CAF3517180.1 unnamed protein product [Rotaria sp. Silwood1]
MNENSMNNDAISVGHLHAEQYPHADNEQRENFTQNRSNLTRFANVTNEINKSLIVLTYLEYSYWSQHRSSIAKNAFAIFTIVIMAIGILIVCFTSPKVTGMFFFIDI